MVREVSGFILNLKSWIVSTNLLNVNLLSGAELIAFVIRSAYDKLPHAFRLEEFFLETDEADVGVGGIPGIDEIKKIETFLRA